MARDKDEVVGSVHELFWDVWEIPGVSEVNGRIDLINDTLEQLIDVVWNVYPCRVEIDFCSGNLVLVHL